MQDRNRNSNAYTLVEIIIVITIMAIVIGVVGSLLAGYTRMFNETDDQAVARQRAQDVFNALEAPIVNCALGIPTDRVPMDYFDTAPIASWRAPLEIRNTASYGTTGLLMGNVLRLVYSVPSGVKNGRTRVNDYGPPASSGFSPAVLTLTKALSGDLVALAGSPNDTRKFITFPNAFMSPLKVTSVSGNTVNVTGRSQPAASGGASSDLGKLVRGEIAPYHDVQLVRAIAAYVDSNSVFHAAEVNDTDVSATNPTGNTNPAGLRVEGIRAVWFEIGTDRKLLTVRVLAEGDIVDQTRQIDTKTRNLLKSRWAGIATLDDRMYYEDFEMTWRIRNYVPN